MDDNKADLHRQLTHLGDMIGDGLHHEPGGKWISQEYVQVARALGIAMPSTRKPRLESETQAINTLMTERVRQVRCTKCGGELKQTRSGSTRAICGECGLKFSLLKINRSKR